MTTPAATSIWRDVAAPGHRSTPAPHRVDVAVIGGGIIGLTAMHHLAARGTSAVLIEAAQPGYGSSTTGSGVVGWSRSVAAPRKIDPRASGYPGLRTAIDGAQTWFADHLATYGLEGALEVPGSVHLVGPKDPGTLGTVDPGRLVQSLFDAIVDAGGAVLVDEPVRSISRHTTGYQVLTSRRKVSATAVIVATGMASGPHPLSELRKRYEARRGRCVVVAADAAVVDAVAPVGRTAHTPGPRVTVARRLDDTTVLIWSPDPGRRRKGTASPRSMAGGVFPQLEAGRVTHQWEDVYGTTLDGIPRIGRINAIWYAGGAADPALGARLGYDVAGLVIGAVASSPFAEIPHTLALTQRIRMRR